MVCDGMAGLSKNAIFGFWPGFKLKEWVVVRKHCGMVGKFPQKRCWPSVCGWGERLWDVRFLASVSNLPRIRSDGVGNAVFPACRCRF